VVGPHVPGEVSTRAKLPASRAKNLLPSRPPGIVVANCKMADFDEFLTILAVDASAFVLLPFEEGLEQGLADDTLVLKEKRAINDSIRQKTSTLT